MAARYVTLLKYLYWMWDIGFIDLVTLVLYPCVINKHAAVPSGGFIYLYDCEQQIVLEI